jgi:hypothetical protein
MQDYLTNHTNVGKVLYQHGLLLFWFGHTCPLLSGRISVLFTLTCKDICGLCGAVYQYVKELFVSVCFRSCVVLTLAKILLFLLLSKFMNYFFCYLQHFFCFPSRTLFIIVRVLVGFPILHPLHPLHLCTLWSIFAASPNGGSAGSAAQRGAGSASR